MERNSVLIVEDDAALLRGLSDNFRSGGYRVLTASDGSAGLALALKDAPDLIVLDIMLPGMNGFEVCRAVRARELEMPIILLTAMGQEADVVRGLNLGADDYVTKPFSIAELLARASAFLRRHKAQNAESYAFGEFRLDLRAHKLLRRGAEVELTPKEFALLQLLASRPGRALTRDEIMDRVWSSVIVTPRSVDRCVTTLRGKIEPDPEHPIYIHTIRDIGYRFEPPEPAAGE
jgi:DNA-binding response OmpR family regulator